MNSIILCEGRTDAILLSYYLIRVYGWEYMKKTPQKHQYLKPTENQEINWYKKGDNYLMIFGVGGKDNFVNVIDVYLSQVLFNYEKEDRFQKVVIMVDKDECSVSEIQKKHIKWLKPYAQQLKDREWRVNEYRDAFGNEQSLDALSIIIPVGKQGALETSLLEAISENEYDKVIVDRCKEFIEAIRPNAEKYITSNRLELKAHLSSVFAIISPEKVFTTLDNIIQEVPWEESRALKECFSALEMLL